jgi:hypothetical protein
MAVVDADKQVGARKRHRMRRIARCEL